MNDFLSAGKSVQIGMAALQRTLARWQASKPINGLSALTDRQDFSISKVINFPTDTLYTMPMVAPLAQRSIYVTAFEYIMMTPSTADHFIGINQGSDFPGPVAWNSTMVIRFAWQFQMDHTEPPGISHNFVREYHPFILDSGAPLWLLRLPADNSTETALINIHGYSLHDPAQ